MRKILLSLLMSITLLCNSTISVYASDFGGGGSSRTDLSGFDTWSLTEKMNFWGYQFEQIVLHVCGLASADSSALQIALESMWDELLLEDCTYEEWITTRLGVRQNESTGENELVVDNELADLIYNASVQYIEDYTGWYNVPVMGYKNYSTTYFDSNAQYDTFTNLCEEYLQDNMVCFVVKANNQYITIDNVRHQGKRVKFIPYEDFLCVNANFSGCFSFRCMKNWLFTPDCEIKDFIVESDGTATEVSHVDSTSDFTEYAWHQLPTGTAYDGANMALLNVNSIVRVYKNIDSLKAYSVGQRPYYITDAFNNYDSTVDNSTTITQTEIDNSVTYGDVYNYITNNYDNPDGLSEDELRAILAEYLSQINNNNSGGGSGGSGDSGGSGGGLGGFLDGLGSVGNAILAILGKLMEILGSAIELVTGSITDLITIIPNSIGELLGALFPVFPEEWIKAITLSLVLGVIVGIVRIFK